MVIIFSSQELAIIIHKHLTEKGYNTEEILVSFNPKNENEICIVENVEPPKEDSRRG